jgi:hypothetical protein
MDATPRVINAIERLKAVFLESPETELTLHDTAAATAVDPSTCQLILDALHDARFLRCIPQGAFNSQPQPSVRFWRLR